MRPPQLRSACLLFAAALSCSCSGAKDVGPLRHVLLISLDTTRADHLGCYGAARVRTPAIDGLASAGVRFGDVTSPAPTTLVAHTSIMTGSWPQTHGVVRNGFMVSQENLMLAELLRDAGFHTAGFLGSFALERRFDFAQGFAHFDEEFDQLAVEWGNDQNQRSADRVTQAVLEHVDEVGGEAERLFLFAHYFDAHAVYGPPPPWDSAYTADGQPATSDMHDVDETVRAHQLAILGQEFGHSGSIMNGFRGPLRPIVGADTGGPSATDQRLADLYAGEVSAMDEAIGDLLAGLGQRGILEDTLVIVTGDHGETFWEHHDLWNHGLWLYQTTVRVPLVLRFPDGRYASTTVDHPISTIDLVPTLCELLELPVGERCDGKSLLPLMEGRTFERGALFSVATQPFLKVEKPGGWRNRLKPHCVREGPWKYVRSEYNQIEQLFHLESDPDERYDLLRGKLTREAGQKLEVLRAKLAEFMESADPLPSAFIESKEAEDRLRELGYGGAGDPDPPDGSPPDGSPPDRPK